jgi:hypothetical protein
VALLLAGNPDASLGFPREGQAEPAYSVVPRMARYAPAGKAIYWLGPEFAGARLQSANDPDIWNLGGYASEREQRDAMYLVYVRAPDSILDWSVEVATFRAKAWDRPGTAPDVTLHMDTGQDVTLRFRGKHRPTPALIARIRVSLRPIPRNVGCIERPD